MNLGQTALRKTLPAYSHRLTGKDGGQRHGFCLAPFRRIRPGSAGLEPTVMASKVPGDKIPDKTLILHWNEDQGAWMELPWLEWVRFRGLGKERASLLVGAEAGEHYFLVCMLGPD